MSKYFPLKNLTFVVVSSSNNEVVQTKVLNGLTHWKCTKIRRPCLSKELFETVSTLMFYRVGRMYMRRLNKSDVLSYILYMFRSENKRNASVRRRGKSISPFFTIWLLVYKIRGIFNWSQECFWSLVKYKVRRSLVG